MATYNIFGSVRSQTTNKGMSGLTVELYNNTGGPVGLPTATTNAAGTFQFVLDDTELTLDPLIVRFKVTEGATTLLNSVDSFAWTEGHVDQVNLFINEDEVVQAKKYVVKGTVTYENGVLAPSLPVKIYHEEFQNRAFLTSAVTDADGKYSIELTADMFGSVPLAVVGISIDIRDSGDTETLATSSKYSVLDVIEANFTLSNENADTTPFEDLTTRIENNTVGDIGDFTDSDIDFLVRNTGYSADKVNTIIKSYKYSSDISSTSPGLMQALAEVRGVGTNPVLKLRESEIRDIIDKAVEDKVIPSHDPGDIDDFVDVAKTFQVEETKNLSIVGEEFTLNDVLSEIFADGGEITTFLETYNDETFENAKDFWDE
jgi:hypothetical protein